MKAVLYTLYQNIGNPLLLDEIAALASKKVKGISAEEILNELLPITARLIFAGYVQVLADKPTNTNIISAKPKVSSFARYQANHQIKNGIISITNQSNKLISFSNNVKPIIELLDGKHTIKEIEEVIIIKLKNNELIAAQGDKKLTEEGDLRNAASQLVSQALEALRLNSILIS
jgi:methyltransferase-like protein